MARRGGGRRTYVRDANGRFASTPGGGGGSKRPKARMAQRGPNRLTRDNAGKITSQGGNGATVRGGRLRTAGGNLRGRVLAKGPVRLAKPGAIRKTDVLKAQVYNSISKNIERRNNSGLNNPVREVHNNATRLARAKERIAGQKRVRPEKSSISRAEPLANGRGTLASRSSLTRAKKNLATNPTPSQRGAVTRANRYAMQSRMKNVGGKRIEPGPGQMRKRPAFERPARWDVKAEPTTAKATPIKPRVPASQRPGSITNTLKNTLRSLAQSDAKRIREVEAITGQPVRAPKRPPAGSGATVRPSGRRSVSGTLGDNLRSLAKSDARYYRELADLTKAPPAKGLKGGKGQGRALAATGANRLSPSPRRLGREEQAVARVMSNPKFRSDASKRRELQRQGLNVDQERLLQIGNMVRKKVNLSPAADRKTARKTLDKALGVNKAKPRRRKP